MTNPRYTAIALVIDQSGSMSPLKDETEQGINGFLDQRRTGNNHCSVLITRFSTGIHITRSHDISHVMPFAMEINGATALLDAIGETITYLGEELSALDEAMRPGNVLVAIMTDGLENASQAWTRERVRVAIERQQNEYNWQFLYMGANQDAILTGAEMGIPSHSSITYAATDGGTKAVTNAMDSYAVSVMSGASPQITEEQRKEAKG